MTKPSIWYADGSPATLEGSLIVTWEPGQPEAFLKEVEDPGWWVSSSSDQRNKRHRYACSQLISFAVRVERLSDELVDSVPPCVYCAPGLVGR